MKIVPLRSARERPSFFLSALLCPMPSSQRHAGKTSLFARFFCSKTPSESASVKAQERLWARLSLTGKDKGVLHKTSPTRWNWQSFSRSQCASASVKIPLLTASQSSFTNMPPCMFSMRAWDKTMAPHVPESMTRGEYPATSTKVACGKTLRNVLNTTVGTQIGTPLRTASSRLLMSPTVCFSTTSIDAKLAV